jgi:predicted nucleic acid-binding protein
MEIINNNHSYAKYLDADIIINDFIFAELCYILTRERYPKVKETLGKYAAHISHAEPETIRKAMEFRIKWKDRNVSITDCVSYLMAKDLGIKFLTGDKEFQNMDNVEFVK